MLTLLFLHLAVLQGRPGVCRQRPQPGEGAAAVPGWRRQGEVVLSCRFENACWIGLRFVKQFVIIIKIVIIKIYLKQQAAPGSVDQAALRPLSHAALASRSLLQTLTRKSDNDRCVCAVAQVGEAAKFFSRGMRLLISDVGNSGRLFMKAAFGALLCKITVGLVKKCTP